MAEQPKISVRLPPALHALLSDRVRQGARMSDMIREAVEAYLGVRPTDSPTDRPTVPTLSDAVYDMSARLTALASDVSDVCARLERLEALETQPAQAERVRQRLTERPTARPTTSPPGPHRGGRPGTLRARILALLGEHRDGLSAEEIRVYLRPDQPLGDVLQGMRRQNKVTTQGRGKATRYFIP